MKMDLAQQLEITKNQTTIYFGLSDIDLMKSYQPGKWTIKQILAHLADAEAVLMERFKRIIAEPKQVLNAFQQDMWNNHLDYMAFPLNLSLDLFLACRNVNIHLVAKFYGAHSAREFIHSETGLRTLGMEMEKLATHNAHHLEQIRIALNNDTL
jgi:hypothetical protein